MKRRYKYKARSRVYIKNDIVIGDKTVVYENDAGTIIENSFGKWYRVLFDNYTVKSIHVTHYEISLFQNKLVYAIAVM